jgi:hypothetical protein
MQQHDYTNTNKYIGDITIGEFEFNRDTRNAICWDDLNASNEIYPELTGKALDVIKQCLGYLPISAVYIPYFPFLKTLIHEHQVRNCKSKYFEKEIINQIKLIRNQDMEQDFFDRSLIFYDDYQERYRNFHSELRYVVKDRMTFLLGYEPCTKYSFLSELYLRGEIAGNYFNYETINPCDYRAIVVYRFRRKLIDQGKEAAYNSCVLYRI